LPVDPDPLFLQLTPQSDREIQAQHRANYVQYRRYGNLLTLFIIDMAFFLSVFTGVSDRDRSGSVLMWHPESRSEFVLILIGGIRIRTRNTNPDLGELKFAHKNEKNTKISVCKIFGSIYNGHIML